MIDTFNMAIAYANGQWTLANLDLCWHFHTMQWESLYGMAEYAEADANRTLAAYAMPAEAQAQLRRTLFETFPKLKELVK